jgi:sugar lactone lactonase YvrE
VIAVEGHFLKYQAVLTTLVSVLASSSAFAGSLFITSRDFGTADLHQFSLSGTLLQTLPGNGLNNGQGVAIGPNGNLFVANESGADVLQYNAITGAFISNFASTANFPGPILFGPDANLYVGAGNSVQRFNGLSGAFIGTFAIGLNSASGMAFDANGNLFVSDGVLGTVKKFDSTGAFVSTFVSGQPALANGAGGILFNGANLLVAATYGNGGPPWGNRILAFDPNGNQLADFANDANLNGPSAMAFGPDGLLYISNYAGASVVRYNAAGQFVDTFIANGPGSMRGIAFVNDTAPGQTETPEPASIALAAAGLVTIAALRKRGNK